jgi:hypothetical protein
MFAMSYYDDIIPNVFQKYRHYDDIIPNVFQKYRQSCGGVNLPLQRYYYENELKIRRQT